MSNFEPKDLNFETVKQIFQECMPKEGETKNITGVILQQKSNGFPKDSDPIYFDADKLNKNTETIRYLLGQLHVIHQGNYFFKISDILKKYNGYLWSKEKIASIFLLHLGLGSLNISAPLANEMSCLAFQEVIPTLSPKDPRFDEWYKNYKQKTLKKSGGQEPADD